MTFKETTDGSFVVGQVWAKRFANLYLLDQVRAHLDYPAARQAVRDLSLKWPATIAKYVEDKANGPAVVADLRGSIPGMLEVSPEGGKEVRANAASAWVESGNVYLPHPALHAWVEDFIDECSKFPNGKYDDQVDAFTQYAIKAMAIKASTVHEGSYIDG